MAMLCNSHILCWLPNLENIEIIYNICETSMRTSVAHKINHEKLRKTAIQLVWQSSKIRRTGWTYAKYSNL